MGLLSKPVVDALRGGIRKWRHLTSEEQDALTGNLISGHEQLARILKGEHPTPDAVTFSPLIMPPNARSFEWAGTATPWGVSPRPRTDQDFNQVGVAIGGVDDEVMYHSHPYHSKTELGKLGSSLSSVDIDNGVDAGFGVTSLDSIGGMGVMLPNRNAVREIKNRGRYLPVERVVADVEGKVNKQFRPARIKISQQLSATGKPSPVWSSFDQQHHLWSPAADEVSADAVGTVLERLGVADHFSYMPKNAADAAERAAHLSPMTQFAEDAAEDMLVQRLKEMGFSNGRISAILASAGSAGAIGSLLAHLTRQEATKDQHAAA